LPAALESCGVPIQGDTLDPAHALALRTFLSFHVRIRQSAVIPLE
jgi:hypothetical protein